MHWRRNLRLSAAALWRSPWRTVLSASGVAIGIAAVAMVFALGAGARRELEATLELMGRNLLVVNAGRTQTGALRGASRRVRTLELADWRALAEQVPGVERAAPVTLRAGRLRAGGESMLASVLGSTAELQEARRYTVLAGRFVDADDERERRRVAVLGARVVGELYRGEWPLGETLRVDGVPFTVIGVLAAKGAGPDGADQDDVVVVPVSTALRRLLNARDLDRVFVQAVSKRAMADVEDGIRDLLRRRHRLAAGEDDDFDLQDQDALLAAQAETGGAMSRVVAGLAALTLFLGGVGLFAVSLLSVRERWSEIGLRRAVGALRRQIALQFLAEAVLVAGLGGLAGLALGGVGIVLGEELSGWPLAFTWRSIVYPFAVSLGLAVAAGAYPALRAARLDPIVALRSP